MARLQVYRRTNPQDSGSPTFTVMIGANDVEAYGPEVNRQWIFQRTLAASLAWLALPRAAKIFGQDTGVRLTGEWTADNALQAGVALQSRTLDSTAGVTLTTDGAIYVAYRIIDGNGGAASVTIDGENVGTLEARGVGGAKIRTWHGVEDTVALARYAVSPGRHSIVLTVCKGEPTKDTFSLVWIGAAAVRSGAVMPRVLTAGVLRQKGDTKKELTAQYDGFVRNIVGTLAADGLRVRFVSVRDYVNASTDMSDRLHPNDRGHQGLRSAFLSQVREERRE